jgi:hypothetical protein
LAYVSGAVEGPSDEAVLRRIVVSRGAEVHRVQIQNGKANLRRALPGYNNAAQRDPWLVLVDLDQDSDCPAALASEWLPTPSAYMRFRVVVRQIESWLLADAERFASFFAVRRNGIPGAPDQLQDAKAALLAVVANSRRRVIRQDMIPRPSSGRRVGPVYTSRLIEFASNVDEGWRPEVAADHSPSLARCVSRLNELLEIAP